MAGIPDSAAGGGGMRLESNSIDDLNQMAQAEFDADPEAILTLNKSYEAAKSCYLALFKLLRAKAEQG
jgi:hypothetical protein